MKQTCGHFFHDDHKATFRVWAPKCKTIELATRNNDTEHFLAMQGDDTGFFQVTTENIRHGDAYRFRLDGSDLRPDPAAHAFESSVHQWNVAVDHRRYPWKCDPWAGVAKRDLVIYEMHIGTFTQKGTFESAQERLGELVELGINAIEILPLAQCPGKWNWGYDGVGLFAVQNTYGSPEDFKGFVDHCHGLGIAVILDVVFNHLGPEGNYLSNFCPFFTNKRKTPWGDAINFDGKDNRYVREFMADCAVHWIGNYHLDGLRFDAVHFMFDDSDEPVSMSITKAIDQQCAELGWPIHLIGETNVRNADLTRGTSPHATGFDAVWSDCMMHSVLGIGQPGLDLCHRDHNGGEDLARVLHQGFLYENYPYQRNDLGERADLDSFVIGFQNHDTVGNHPLGLRIHQLASREFQMAAAALYLLYPAIPMIFMGEEFAAESPFLFFVDFADPWVRDGVEKGRAGEFPELSKKLGGLSPLDERAFHQSRLDARIDGDQGVWQWYRSLISMRKKLRTEGLIDQANLVVESDPQAGLFQLRYCDANKDQLSVFVRLHNPAAEPSPAAIEIASSGRLVLDSCKVGATESGTGSALAKHSIGVNQAMVFQAT